MPCFLYDFSLMKMIFFFIRAHEPESREWQQEYGDNYFQQTGSQDIRRHVGYPRTHLERGAEGRPHVTRSAEDPFRNPQHAAVGGAHPMWDYRDDRGALGPTHTDTSYR